MKRRKLLLVVVGLILLAAAGGGLYRGYFYSPLGRVVTDLYFQGIILAPGNYPSDRPFTGTWEITPNDIHEMEPRLAKHVRRKYRLVGNRISTELRYYRRQYLGLLDENGEKLIDISLCHQEVTGRRDWLQNYSQTVGGGDNYWRITYDVYTKTFSDFLANEPN